MTLFASFTLETEDSSTAKKGRGRTFTLIFTVKPRDGTVENSKTKKGHLFSVLGSFIH